MQALVIRRKKIGMVVHHFMVYIATISIVDNAFCDADLNDEEIALNLLYHLSL
jgi:hypothetical protein